MAKEVINLFPVATILWVLSFCVPYVGHYIYTSDNAQDAMRHAINSAVRFRFNFI